MAAIEAVRSKTGRWAARMGGLAANGYACPRCGDRDGFEVGHDDTEALSSLLSTSIRVLHCRGCSLTIVDGQGEPRESPSDLGVLSLPRWRR